jgi:hypothetical protein
MNGYLGLNLGLDTSAECGSKGCERVREYDIANHGRWIERFCH